jgi:hypothetical protein
MYINQVEHHNRRPNRRRPLLVPSLRHRRRRPERLERSSHEDCTVACGASC